MSFINCTGFDTGIRYYLHFHIAYRFIVQQEQVER